jgi:hypothetical protein
MRALSHDDALVWCEAHSVRVSSSGHLYFSLDAAHSLLLNSPPANRADDLLRALLPQPSEALFWIRPRDAWSESPGDKLFRGLRSAWGIEQTLAERPALLFQPAEQSHLLAALLPALLFNWDAYLSCRPLRHKVRLLAPLPRLNGAPTPAFASPPWTSPFIQRPENSRPVSATRRVPIY